MPPQIERQRVEMGRRFGMRNRNVAPFSLDSQAPGQTGAEVLTSNPLTRTLKTQTVSRYLTPLHMGNQESTLAARASLAAVGGVVLTIVGLLTILVSMGMVFAGSQLFGFGLIPGLIIFALGLALTRA